MKDIGVIAMTEQKEEAAEKEGGRCPCSTARSAIDSKNKHQFTARDHSDRIHNDVADLIEQPESHETKSGEGGKEEQQRYC